MPILARTSRILLPLLAIAAPLAAQSLIDTFQTNATFGFGGVQTMPDAIDRTSYGFSVYLGSWPAASFPAADYPTSVTYLSSENTVTVPIADPFHMEWGPTSSGTYSTVTQLDPSGFFFTNFALLHSGVPTSPLSISATLHGGTLDGVNYSATGDPSRLPSTLLFSPETFGRLLSLQPDSGLVTLNFSSFSVPAGSRDATYFFDLIGSGGTIFETALLTDATTTSFDTGLLQSGQSYAVTLRASYTADDGVNYSTATELDFTTAAVPEPAVTVTLFGLAACACVVWRRRHG